MKKFIILVLVFSIFAGIFSGCTSGAVQANKDIPKPKYKDGIYENTLDVDHEGFTASMKMEIKNNRIISVDWKIVDRSGRPFDKTYEEEYKGHEKFMNDCRRDMKGFVAYGPKLIEVQDIDKVDGISGATWTRIKFKALVKNILREARQE